jgi:sugar/nucleoside kinase (ribokinase family)
MLLYGLGYAILDLYVNAPAFPPPLKAGEAVHLGSAPFDALLAALPPPVVQAPGGSVFNTLKTAAALGAKTIFTGSCGLDSTANVVRQLAAKAGVECRLEVHGGSTGRFLVVNADDTNGTTDVCGSNSLVSEANDLPTGVLVASPGAAVNVDSAQFDTGLAGRADCILLEGMLFSHDKGDLANTVLDFCVTNDKPLAIACATPFGADKVGLVLAERSKPLPRLFLFANEAEWARLRARKIEPGIFPHMVCLETRGEKGGSLWEGRAETRWQPARIPGKPVDESGAGDVFAGVFLTRYPAQETRKAAVLANAAKLAAAVCAVPLCQVPKNAAALTGA